ncbi:MAG: glycosyltransferase [Gemmatimonadaceae bacterium]|nr:glycosyltransferase [Gemmatimonadaceae bacterium]
MPSPLPHLAADTLDVSLIVHSHLRWDFVWQRPQQILSRLAQRGHVLFVEEPVHLDDISTPRLDVSLPMPRVHRAVPILPGELRGRYDESIAIVRDLVRRQIAADGPLGGLFDRPVQWFYTPMPAPAMIGAFDERGIVYDCMDELSKFRFAPTELVDRERYLVAQSDVVFTGGYRLSRAKSRIHRNVHFFGCGVDVDHFARARSEELPLAPELVGLGKKVMGYFGVVDERLDYDLLRILAARNPDAELVMVGPVVKVDPRELPQAPNIRWLGQRQYAELPSYVKGFDVCLMPFALNEATEYINPTKTLEYMAAGKPIVSTAVSDVVHNFTPVVAVAESRDEFVNAVRHALVSPDMSMVARGIEQARANTWESIVARMDRIMREALRVREERPAAVASERSSRRGERVSRSSRTLAAAADEIGD